MSEAVDWVMATEGRFTVIMTLLGQVVLWGAVYARSVARGLGRLAWASAWPLRTSWRVLFPAAPLPPEPSEVEREALATVAGPGAWDHKTGELLVGPWIYRVDLRAGTVHPQPVAQGDLDRMTPAEASVVRGAVLARAKAESAAKEEAARAELVRRLRSGRPKEAKA